MSRLPNENAARTRTATTRRNVVFLMIFAILCKELATVPGAGLVEDDGLFATLFSSQIKGIDDLGDLDVPVANIPATLSNRTGGDSNCLFHEKIRSIKIAQSSYVVIDTLCPSPFFMIRWIGPAIVSTDPIIKAVIPLTPDGSSNITVNTESVVDNEVSQRYPTSNLYKYDMSTAPSGRYSLEIVGIRCDFVNDLQNLVYDPRNNTPIMKDTTAQTAGVPDPKLMFSLSCVHNPLCGILNEPFQLHWNNTETTKPNELWVLEADFADPKLSLRYQEPFCFLDKTNLTRNERKFCFQIANAQDWHLFRYKTRIKQQDVLAKLEAASVHSNNGQEKLTLCSFGDSHSRYIAHRKTVQPHVYVFVHFINVAPSEMNEKGIRSGKRTIQLEVDDGSLLTIPAKDKNLITTAFCSSARSLNGYCITSPYGRYPIPTVRGHFGLPDDRRIVAVQLEDYPSNVTVHLSLEPDDFMGEFAIWKGLVQDSHSVGLQNFRVPVPETARIRNYNMSRVDIRHIGLQRPTKFSFQKQLRQDCDYIAINMGQWMATDPYTLDRIEHEMKVMVSEIQEIVADPTSRVRYAMWRSHNYVPLRCTNIVCPVTTWSDPCMTWVYNQVMKNTVLKYGQGHMSWFSHEHLLQPAWDRADDWNHPMDVFYYIALQVVDVFAEHAHAWATTTNQVVL